MRGVKRTLPSLLARKRIRILEFFKWHAKHAQDGPIDKITVVDVKRYLDSCRRRGNGNQTLNAKLTALQELFRYMVHAGVILEDPTTYLQRFDQSNDLVHAFSRQEVLRLFSVLQVNREKDLRNAVFIILAAFAGLRTDEIVSLNVDHIFDAYEDGKCIALKVIKTKRGSGNRTITLWQAPSAIVRSLQIARLENGAKKGDPLLESYWKTDRPRGNQRLIRKSLNNLLNVLADRAGIRKDPIKPHMLRATYAISLLRIGYGMPQIMGLLGCKHLSSVDRYLINGESTRKEYDSLSSYWSEFDGSWKNGSTADRGEIQSK